MSERRDHLLRMLCATASTIWEKVEPIAGMHCFCPDNPIRPERDHTFEMSEHVLDIMVRGALKYAELPWEGKYRQILSNLRPFCPNCPGVQHAKDANFCRECGVHMER